MKSCDSLLGSLILLSLSLELYRELSYTWGLQKGGRPWLDHRGATSRNSRNTRPRKLGIQGRAAWNSMGHKNRGFTYECW